MNLSELERIITQQQESRVLHLLKNSSVRLEVYRQQPSTFYGKQTGNAYNHIDSIDGVITGDDFFVADTINSGGFVEAWMITLSDIPEVGDTIAIVREDGGERRYTIDALVSVGVTRSVFKRFKLSHIGK